ncbi:Fe-S protein assembly co-chaperone HscB [uncultured Aquitalea sp.]|uniref:Fe-S protein assembly co-chaperone HscB n=1 Tax=uncultured Aquitalea sp. TaxID=540272 RepID=UPI0025E572D0|nr:Fe-S protein assembly co-chaperone HscB [uncultured Aquitalea sp.]
MTTDFTQDFFSLLGLPRAFALDTERLDHAWRTAAAEVHPDRHASRPEAEKRVALMMATRVNEAYQTLKNPVNRGRYLLSLQGVDTGEETNTSMPADFLMAQMEWRESIEDARDSGEVEALDALSARLRDEMRERVAELAVALDTAPDLDAAALLVRKLRFLEKLEQEIGDAIESLLG